MGYRHDQSDISAAALAVAREQGIGQVSFGSVARHLGIADRTVVYYFPTKEALVTDVLVSLGAELQAMLGAAFGVERVAPDELMARAWPVLSNPKADPAFRIFFEALGHAVAGAAPYADLAPLAIDGWVAWVEGLIDAPAADRRRLALGVVARLDGLLLLRQVRGARAANQAARAVGISR